MKLSDLKWKSNDFMGKKGCQTLSAMETSSRSISNNADKFVGVCSKCTYPQK